MFRNINYWLKHITNTKVNDYLRLLDSNEDLILGEGIVELC